MPRRLSEYGFDDYLRLRPLTQGIKTAKYRAMDRRYMALPAAFGDLTALRAAIGGKRILVTVAFDDPAGLDMQCALVRHYVDADLHVVADNSNDPESIHRNRGVAASHRALYLALPENPWTSRNDSRSHGIAMNWLWHNLIRPGKPSMFGFIDHDLFPIEPATPFAPLAQHDFCGDIRFAKPGFDEERWFLWAGYCLFRYDAVASKPLDFGLDWFVGLDTGGGNWDVLYRHVDWRSVNARPVQRISALPDLSLDEAYFERRGEWVHEVGWPRDPAIRERKRVFLTRMLGPHLEAAAGVPAYAATFSTSIRPA